MYMWCFPLLWYLFTVIGESISYTVSHSDHIISWITSNLNDATVIYLGNKANSSECETSCKYLNYLCDKSSSDVIVSDGASFTFNNADCEITIAGSNAPFIGITSNLISTQYRIDVELSVISGFEPGIYFKSNNALNDQYLDYYMGIDPGSQIVLGYDNPNWVVLETLTTVNPQYNTKYTLSVDVNGTSFTAYYEGTPFYTGSFQSAWIDSYAGVYSAASDVIYYSWKINIKDGEGDKVCAAYVMDKSSGDCYGYYGTDYTQMENTLAVNTNYDAAIIYPFMPDTNDPTVAPSKPPTYKPTDEPSETPTAEPSKIPSNDPSKMPSEIPTFNPSKLTTAEPSNTPADNPSIVANIEPKDTKTTNLINDYVTEIVSSHVGAVFVEPILKKNDDELYLYLGITCVIVICCVSVAVFVGYTQWKYKKERKISHIVADNIQQTNVRKETELQQRKETDTTERNNMDTQTMTEGGNIITLNCVQCGAIHDRETMQERDGFFYCIHCSVKKTAESGEILQIAEGKMSCIDCGKYDENLTLYDGCYYCSACMALYYADEPDVDEMYEEYNEDPDIDADGISPTRFTDTK